MNALTIESLGISKDDIADRVVERVVERLLSDVDDTDEYGNPVGGRSKFHDQMRERIKAQIDLSISEVAAKHVLPNITSYLETLIMQQTNSWGEKKGEQLSFIEYLVKRADHWIVEEVNYEGKSKEENGSWGSWSKAGTRVAHMVNKHLQYSIETAMKAAMADANSKIVGGLEQAIKIKLGEVQASLKVSATVGK